MGNIVMSIPYTLPLHMWGHCVGVDVELGPGVDVRAFAVVDVQVMQRADEVVAALALDPDGHSLALQSAIQSARGGRIPTRLSVERFNNRLSDTV